MKLYYHPASSTSRPVMLFAAENQVPLEMQVVDLFTGEHYQPPTKPSIRTISCRCSTTAISVSPRARRSSISGRQDRLAAVPQGPARACTRQRAHGLGEYQLCRDLAYGTVYRRSFPSTSAAARKRRARSCSGDRSGHRLAQGARPAYPRRRQALPLRRCDDDRGLFRLVLRGARRTDRQRPARLPERARLARPHEGAEALAEVNQVIDGYAATLKGQEMVAV